MVKRFIVLASVSLVLAACQQTERSTRHLTPIPPATLSLMAQKGMSPGDPILIRAYKKEAELEVWKRGGDGRYALLKTYPICRWSGQLGPKVREGDRQAPEGFYTVTPAQMNPNSAYYLSFDTGFPNAYDRAHGRTGSHLMVHGTCSSSGCFAMTDETIAEVYAVAREAFAGGQRGFQFQSYPFRMTAENLAKHRLDPNIAFWKNLKEGSDYFEVTKREPSVGVCGQRYAFGGADVGQGSCSPLVEPAVAEKRERDERQVAELVAKGVPAVKVLYADGGQHASFTQALTAAAGGGDSPLAVLALAKRPNLGEVSRPEALAQGPREIVLDAAKPKPGAPAAALAYAGKTSPGLASPGLTAPGLAKPAAKAAPKPGATPALAQARPAAGTRATSAEAALARAGAPEPAASPAAPAPVPLYQRMIGNLFGSSSPAAETETAQPSGLSAPPPAVAPAPPRRKTSAAAPADRRAEASRLHGAQPVLQAGLTAPVP